MSPIWITFALIMGGFLLIALIGIPIVLCMLDSHEGPRVRHVDVAPVTRQLSMPAKDLSERLTQRRSREQEIIAERVKQAEHAREIDSCVLRKIDDLYEMAHGNKHEV